MMYRTGQSGGKSDQLYRRPQMMGQAWDKEDKGKQYAQGIHKKASEFIREHYS